MIKAGRESVNMIPYVKIPNQVYQSEAGRQLAFKVAGMFGEEEDGLATKNRGENSDPEKTISPGTKEQGDGLEQLKDVGGGPKDHDSQSPEGGMHSDLQEKAIKSFELNKPLVLEFFHSDEDGSTNPILQALDQMLEQAFPGYRAQGEEHHDHEVSESPEERDSEEESSEKDERDDKKMKEGAVNALWEVLAYGEMSPAMAPAAAPGVIPGQQGQQMINCPRCGYPHEPGMPCPAEQATPPNMAPGAAANAAKINAAPYAVGMSPVQPPIPQKVVTYKTAVTSWPEKESFDNYQGDQLDPAMYGENGPGASSCPMCGGPGHSDPRDPGNHRCKNCGAGYTPGTGGIGFAGYGQGNGFDNYAAEKDPCHLETVSQKMKKIQIPIEMIVKMSATRMSRPRKRR
jgi:hypothetical protein